MKKITKKLTFIYMCHLIEHMNGLLRPVTFKQKKQIRKYIKTHPVNEWLHKTSNKAIENT